MSASSIMKTVAVGEFKATCLRLMEEVRRTGRPLLVTKRGQPLVQLVPPPRGRRARQWADCLKGTVDIVGDIVAPAVPADEWEATR